MVLLEVLEVLELMVRPGLLEHPGLTGLRELLVLVEVKEPNKELVTLTALLLYQVVLISLILHFLPTVIPICQAVATRFY